MKPFNFSHAEQLIGKVVKHISSEAVYLIAAVTDNGVFLYSLKYTYDILFEDFTFFDGTPCGVEEEFNLTFIEVLQSAKEGDSFKSNDLFKIMYENNIFYYFISPDDVKNCLILDSVVINAKYKKL
jgi:hypothetical protein